MRKVTISGLAICSGERCLLVGNPLSFSRATPFFGFFFQSVSANGAPDFYLPPFQRTLRAIRSRPSPNCFAFFGGGMNLGEIPIWPGSDLDIVFSRGLDPEAFYQTAAFQILAFFKIIDPPFRFSGFLVVFWCQVRIPSLTFPLLAVGFVRGLFGRPPWLHHSRDLFSGYSCFFTLSQPQRCAFCPSHFFSFCAAYPSAAGCHS